MDLLIKVTGYNSKFFFLLKTGLEVQTNAYSQSAKRAGGSGVSRREHEIEDFTLVIDYQMQLESEEPSH